MERFGFRIRDIFLSAANKEFYRDEETCVDEVSDDELTDADPNIDTVRDAIFNLFSIVIERNLRSFRVRMTKQSAYPPAKEPAGRPFFADTEDIRIITPPHRLLRPPSADSQ